MYKQLVRVLLLTTACSPSTAGQYCNTVPNPAVCALLVPQDMVMQVLAEQRVVRRVQAVHTRRQRAAIQHVRRAHCVRIEQHRLQRIVGGHLRIVGRHLQCGLWQHSSAGTYIAMRSEVFYIPARHMLHTLLGSTRRPPAMRCVQHAWRGIQRAVRVRGFTYVC